MRLVLTVDALSAAHRQAIADEWWYRAWSEREGTQRYARLTGALRQAEVPTALVDACASARDDEARHATLCADVAGLFSSVDAWADAPLDTMPLGPARLDAADRLLYEMVAFGCISETLNAALLLATYNAAEHDAVRATAHALLTDEVKHGQLGWGLLTWAAKRRPVGMLAQLVGPMVAGAASKTLFHDDVLCATWSAPQFGFLPQARRIEVFVGCVRAVIIPGLTHLGVSPLGVSAWLDSQAWATR
ncbi:MAG: hypothetical protein ACI9U2_003353 [Bradymonadia bacterium]